MRKLFLLLLVLLGYTNLFSQEFMMQGWYWDYPKTANGAEWSDTLNTKAISLGEAGFTQLWLPPLSRASFGSNSNGYDPQDLYDLGEFGLGPTGFASRMQVDALITSLGNNGIAAIADVVYNHRDGGKPEDNPAVEGWIENFDCTKVNNGDNAFPSDRYRNYLPLGGTSGNGAGTYYFKIASASKHPNYYGKTYNFYVETNTTGFQNLANLVEIEGNGGGDCGQGNNTVPLGVDMQATIDDVGACGGFCGIDEFAVTINLSDINLAGDTLWIYMTNSNGDYSDHYISGIWNGSLGANVQDQIRYQTYTDFTAMPSGQGGMNWENFKPNGNPTQLNGDWDWLWFFYDYDQNVLNTQTTLFDWTEWLFNDVKIKGLRMDAVKHFNPQFVSRLLNNLDAKNIPSAMNVGEFYDGNSTVLKAWIDDVKGGMNASTLANYDIRLFDFALRNSLKDACDAFGYDARNVFNAGMVNEAGASSREVVTFVNNHDFRDAGQAVQNDPMLAYAYTLTNNQVGLPCVYYPDYFGTAIPNSPEEELGSQINELMRIHADHIVGSSTVDYLNAFGSTYNANFITGFESTTLLYQLSDNAMGSEVIVAINFAGESLKLEHEINMSSFLAGDTLRELTSNSNSPELIINGNRIQLNLPARSYAVWVKSNDYSCNAPTIIHVNQLATGNNSGEDWDNAYPNLQSALNKAKICSGVEEIWVAEGTFFPTTFDNRDYSFSLPANVSIYGGFPVSGNPEFTDRNAQDFPSILSGDIELIGDRLDNVFHVVKIDSNVSSSILDGFFIEFGNADGIELSEQIGGGIYALGNCNFKDIVLSNCFASMDAPCVFSSGGSANLSMEDCTFIFPSGTVNPLKNENGANIRILGNCIIKE